ncbi:IclR family transcriptional regulator [Paenibacillus sp. CC-CFT747]|nr:IclR family transcriptional regulator [Paenibacillus sp. CC-CFT747]
MKETDERQERYTIQSIDKALDLMELLSERGSLSLIELTELLQQPKSSTYRIVLTLENRGFISRSDVDGKYCLGYKQLILTKNLLEQSNIRTAAFPEMKKLSDLYGDTINLGVLTEGTILYLEIIESMHALRMTDSVGSKSPFHATAMGKAIASHMSESAVDVLIRDYGLERYTDNTITTPERLREELALIRKRGFAMDDQEIVEGARCLAAPIFGLHGHINGAISISGPMHRYTDEKVPEIAANVMAAAAVISRKLGAVPSSSPVPRS